MKIYILPVNDKFMPKTQPFKYPQHNKDFGVEQDFYLFLQNNKDYLTDDPQKADWHYIPIFWTRWHLNHNYGKEGLEELQNEVDRLLLDDNKTFTVCQYDDGTVVNIKKSKAFLASRKTNEGYDIPLLCSPHKEPFFKPQKKYLASFLGRIATHPIRQSMLALLKDRRDVFIYDGSLKTNAYVKKIMESYISLCPRGYGGSSFRFFESMQLGVVPFLVGDIDTRPFKNFINWDEMSFYSENTENMLNIIKNYDNNKLISMGLKCKEFYYNNLIYQKWCKYVIYQLEDVKNG
ncbi:MAG: hypothetical protein A2086_00960 [Spirochaetes bacterium GWD1_27_9]|nr:MAG: hypothetical protein A2Z98_03835 [Spirochaetes bacterium GWB1_27_13]OHD24211.1 MAG: hypothetical protein A2Y34_02520 [Spirochaetes bacterium GWC1_27_15]OHD33622.1 MAG: hypothetical protein A2086_00960 [Spirochaetes bacterium GWD1_27_9]